MPRLRIRPTSALFAACMWFSGYALHSLCANLGVAVGSQAEYGAAFVGLGTGFMLIHELSHVAAGFMLGMKWAHFEIGFGAKVAMDPPDDFSAWADLWFSVSGPIVHFIVASVMALALMALGLPWSHPLILCALVLGCGEAIANLLPIFPGSDGRQVLYAIVDIMRGAPKPMVLDLD